MYIGRRYIYQRIVESKHRHTDRQTLTKTKRRMNINHIAKKPFFDLFYRTPCMPIILRAALYDATLHTAAGKPR